MDGSLPDSVEVPVVEYEQELVVVLETLHCVCDTLGEIPDIALFDLS